jgi:hypothetical protein
MTRNNTRAMVEAMRIHDKTTFVKKEASAVAFMSNQDYLMRTQSY